jgi:hypothetical protein
VRVDNTNPTPGSFTLPTFTRNGQSLTNAATDGGSGVASVQYFYCQGASCTPATSIGSSTSGPSYSVTWNSQPADAANYRVLARVTDNAGNTADSAMATTTIDNTNPTGSITAPTNSAIVSGSAVSVTSSSADATSGVASAQFQVAPHSGSFSNLGSADTSSPYGVTWNTTSGFPNGDYDLRVITTDNAGNTFTSPTITVTVSNSVLTMTGGTKQGGSGNATFKGTGASGSAVVTVVVCKVNSFPCSAGNTAATVSTAANPPASWTTAATGGGPFVVGTTYWAQATQGSSTSAVFSFVFPSGTGTGF